jgi:hypothetical protein
MWVKRKIIEDGQTTDDTLAHALDMLNILCFRKVALHVGYRTVRVQACIDGRGYHFQQGI